MAFGSDYLDQKALGLIFGGITWSIPGTYYIGLSTATSIAAAQTGTNVPGEIPTTGTGYARAPLTNSGTYFTVPTQINGSGNGYQVQNSQTVSYTAATSNWGTISTVFVADAVTGGNILAVATITPTPVNTNQTAQFAPNTLTFQLT